MIFGTVVVTACVVVGGAAVVVSVQPEPVGVCHINVTMF